MPIGVLLTLPNNLWLDPWRRRLTIGFSAAIDRFKLGGLEGRDGEGAGSALYLFFYYVGSSLAGSIGGWVFTLGAWPGEAAFLGGMSALALLIALKLARVPPPAHLRAS